MSTNHLFLDYDTLFSTTTSDAKKTELRILPTLHNFCCRNRYLLFFSFVLQRKLILNCLLSFSATLSLLLLQRSIIMQEFMSIYERHCSNSLGRHY